MFILLTVQKRTLCRIYLKTWSILLALLDNTNTRFVHCNPFDPSRYNSLQHYPYRYFVPVSLLTAVTWTIGRIQLSLIHI